MTNNANKIADIEAKAAKIEEQQAKATAQRAELDAALAAAVEVRQAAVDQVMDDNAKRLWEVRREETRELFYQARAGLENLIDDPSASVEELFQAYTGMRAAVARHNETNGSATTWMDGQFPPEPKSVHDANPSHGGPVGRFGMLYGPVTYEGVTFSEFLEQAAASRAGGAAQQEQEAQAEIVDKAIAEAKAK